jgi:PAS domain S-box-containing protein
VKPILPTLPAAGAVVEADNIDGAAVLASLVAIPESSWFLLYEVARDDALSGWPERSLLILTLMAAVVLAIAAMTLVLWYGRWWTHYRSLYHTETQRRAAAERAQVIVCQDQKAQRDSARRLAASEYRHRTVIESAPHAIFIQAEGRFVYANPACLALLEADSPEQLLGRPVLECFAPAHHDEIRERIRRLNELREPTAIAEEEVVSLNGQVIPVEVNAVPFDADGKPGALVFMLDIRERRQTQAVLAHQYAMLARTERLAGIGSWEWDLANDQGRWSDELYRILGLPRSERAPDFAEQERLYVAEDFERLRRAVDACVASGTPYELEVRAIRANGEVRRCVARGLPERDEQGRIRLLFGSLQDVDERRRLEDQQRHLLAAIEQAVESIVVTDREGVIEYVNPAFEGTTGYVPEEAIGHRTNLLKSGRQDDAFYRELWQTISSGQVWRGEMVNRRKDGTLYTEESSISPVFGDDGAIINYVAVKHDVSDRRRLESQFQQAQKMEAVGRLAGGVAHDFNNMLTVILGHVELAIQKLPPAEPLHADLAEIARAAKRSSEVTSQLLGFARQQTISPKVMALNEMVEKMLTMVRRLIGEDIDLGWRPAADLWPVKMDPGQINQILMNLCANARDAIHGTGKVIIETRNVTLSEDFCAEHAGFVPGDFVLLSVTDDGHGMDRETLHHVFDPFFTTKGPAEGTGLGLATTYGIVTQNNGFISVHSEPGEGAIFKIYLPRCPDEAASRVSGHAPEVRRGSGEIVLLVEDDPGLLQLGRRMLENLGYTVLAAGMPEEALEIAGEQGEKIQLLITDVIMPGMNGRILADKIQQQCPQLGVLFVSGYTADALAHRSVLDNGVTFLQKPFSLGELALKVREALENKSLSPPS